MSRVVTDGRLPCFGVRWFDNPSTVKMAGKDNPGHLILVSPNAPAGVDFLAPYRVHRIVTSYDERLREAVAELQTLLYAAA